MAALPLSLNRDHELRRRQPPSGMNSKGRFPTYLGPGVSIIASHGAPDMSPASVSPRSREGVCLLLSSAVRDAVVAQQLRAVFASSSQDHLQVLRLDDREVIRHMVDLVVRGEVGPRVCEPSGGCSQGMEKVQSWRQDR